MSQEEPKANVCQVLVYRIGMALAFQVASYLQEAEIVRDVTIGKMHKIHWATKPRRGMGCV
jgi:hypothetical protein